MYEIIYLRIAEDDIIRIARRKKSDVAYIRDEIPKKLGQHPLTETGGKKPLSKELPESIKKLISSEFGQEDPSIRIPWNVHLARDMYRAVYVVQSIDEIIEESGREINADVLNVDGVVSVLRVFPKPLTEEFNRALERWDGSMPQKIVREKTVSMSDYISWKRLLRKMSRQASDAIAAGDFKTHDELFADLDKRERRRHASRR